MDQLFAKQATISGEICWLLNLVTSEYSINSSANSGDLFSVKMFLILFHGQLEAKRGFSINKQLLVENLKTKSLVLL